MTKTTLVQPKQPRYPREIAFMNEMKDKGISLIYEPRTFYLSSGSRYTPDFYDPAEDKYYELISTRQRWHQFKDKLRLFKIEYPDINFEIIAKYRKKKSRVLPIKPKTDGVSISLEAIRYRVIEHLGKNGMCASSFAKENDINPPTFHRFLTGQTAPNIQNLNKILNGLQSNHTAQ